MKKSTYWKNDDTDSTDGVFDLLTTLSEQVQESLDGNSRNKRFINALTKIFASLLNRKVDTTDKIKKYLKWL